MSLAARWLGTSAIAVLLLAGCAHAPPRATALRVMSYNIAAGNGDLRAVERVIRAADADVVGLQEVDVHWDRRSGLEDQAALLAARLGLHVFFAPIYSLPAEAGQPPREFGVAILSRHPIVRSANHPILRLSTQPGQPDPMPMPGFAEAMVLAGGREMRIFDTHLDYRADPAIRAAQVREMLEIIGTGSDPTVLLGDLNARPDAAEIQPLLGRFRDVWGAVGAGPGWSYPASAPDRRIDYVLVSPDISVGRVEVLPAEASDHRAVVADLLIP